MICKNCGATVAADANFCIFCGATLTPTTEAASPEAQAAPYTVESGAKSSYVSVPVTQNEPSASFTLMSDANHAAGTETTGMPDLSLLTGQNSGSEKSDEQQKKKKPADQHPAMNPVSAAYSGSAYDSSADSEFDGPDDENTDDEEPISEEARTRADEAAASNGIKPRTVGLIALIEVAVLAAAAFIFFQFRTDTIHSVTAETLSISSISVTVDSRTGTDLDIICSTEAGEVERVPVTDSVAIFTDLEPNTAYTFEPVSSKGKLLLSNTSATARTNQETTLNGIAVTSYSATSATLSISGSGPVPDAWQVTLTADDGTVTSESVSGTEFTFDNLTPQTTYTVTVERSDGEPLSGANTCDFTTQGYTILSDFVKTSTGSDSIAVSWSYSGTIPDSWTLTCTDAAGNSSEADVTGTEYTLTGLEAGNVYCITLSCGSMQPTDADTINVLLPGETIFADVAEDSYCYRPVLWAYYTGITSGISDTQFAPDTVCTRAQVVTFLWRLAGKPEPTAATSPFTDVTDSASPTYNAIMWAVEAGITAGTSDTTFSPDETVTRAQVVTFLWRYAGKPASEAEGSTFTDVSSSDPMLQPIMWAVEAGITAGISDTEFSPDGSCTRGQVVTFMYRYLGIE